MTRSTPPLHRHLLTRSDLARLQVPAGDVLAWLSSGELEQIGALTASDDPVFTVLSAPLRQHLAERLATIGKPTVVLTPLRARSFLMRALLACETKGELPTPETTALAPVEPPANPATIDDATLALALQATAAEIEADLEVMLRLAEEEAEIERAESVVAADSVAPEVGADVEPDGAAVPSDEADAVPAEDAPTGDDASDPRETESPSDDDTDGESFDDGGECFEFDDLTSAMDELLPEEPAASTPSAEPASEPVAEPPTIETGDVAAEATVEVETPTELVAEAEEVAAIDAEAPVAAAIPVLDNASPDELTSTESNMPAHAETTHDEEELLAAEAEPEATPEAPAEDVVATDDAVRLPTGDEIAAVLGAFEAATESAPLLVAAETSHAEPETNAEMVARENVPTMPTPEDLVTESTVEEPSATTTAEPTVAATPAATELVTQTLDRVDSFLAQLKDTLVQLAHRPEASAPTPTPPPAPAPAPTIDMAPLVAALQAGFAQSSQQAEASQAAINALGQQVASIGPSLEHGVDRALKAVVTTKAEPVTQRQATEFVITRTSRMPVVMLALAAMVIAWSALFWIKTGSPKLTLGTLVGGNLVACCLLAFGRQR